MKKLLIVEDDTHVRQGLETNLKNVGFSVTAIDSVAKFWILDLSKFDLVVMDWELPDGEGFEILKKLRLQGDSTPVIMLTARDDSIDRVLGLESGANDYLTKPFEIRELIARIKIHLKDSQPSSQFLECGDIKMDLSSLEVLYKGQEVTLTKMELALLQFLMMNPNKALSRNEILDEVWGMENYPTTRTVDMHIKSLRQKTDSDMFETLHGIGYRFKAKK